MITQILLTQTFIMFILMILGLILSKTGLLTEHGSKDMVNILLYAVIPFLCTKTKPARGVASKSQYSTIIGISPVRLAMPSR